MDKNAIKKFATKARHELISRVSQRAFRYGISDKEEGNADDEKVNGYPLSSKEKEQRAALIAQIKAKGYEQVMEEVAYTWFNRFSALRFMEVNGYLPTKVRVFTDEENEFNPQILTEAMHMELSGLDREKVYAYKEANNNDELYKYLLITQCNALNSILPGMFQKISDYTELLFPDNLLRKGSVIYQMIEQIPEDDWKDQVQIIGWLYQYYNSEKKDEVFAALKTNVKISKENIPAATQLFTPDWIVRYMVENSLGRLWLEGHPNDGLKSQWEYYIEEAEQEPEVKEKLAEIRKEYATLTPDSLKVIDPCSGSGHILAYMFDVLMKIYESYGYATRDAVISIMENNLYGLDIDDRAAQLAYFSVMMKGRQYDRRFFSRGIQPHVYAIEESNHVDKSVVNYFCNDDAKLKEAMDTIIAELHDAKEYGSIISVSNQNWDALYARFDEIQNESVTSIYTDEALGLRSIVNVAKAMAQKYHVVITNPPYMGASNMNPKLNDFIKKNYANYKSDFFSAFVIHCSEMAKKSGYCGFFTPYVWMFIQSYEKMRNYLYTQATIETLIQFEYSAFEEATVPVCTFIFQNRHVQKKGCYLRLVDFRGGMEVQRQKTLEAITNHDCGFYYEQSTDNFSKIPGSPVAYWVSKGLLLAFTSGTMLGKLADSKQGIATANNNKYLRLWYEVSIVNVKFDAKTHEEASLCSEKWYPYNKGGAFRKWYGNNDFVVNWQNDGFELRNDKKAVLRNRDFYFKSSVTWSDITSSSNAFRYKPIGHLFDVTGMSVFSNDLSYYLLAFCNTKVVQELLKIIAPTMHCQCGDVANIPVISDEEKREEIERISHENISYSKNDWDSFETSWDFKRHPLLQYAGFTPQMIAKEESNGYLILNGIADAYRHWEQACDDRFNQLKANEEELNRIFIDIYGLQDELTPEVEDKDVTVHRIFDTKDDVPESMQGSQYIRTKRDEVVSFISYAVGCMFGRYSLDVEGLVYAGGNYDSKYCRWIRQFGDKATEEIDENGNLIHGGWAGCTLWEYDGVKKDGKWIPASFAPDADNIIPICDDEYFEDDIVGRFVKFVEVVYGKETLQENLKFIADALGGRGQPKEVIRNYFLNGFYKDHCKTYQKRPIYWLFDSGKKNGFKCLIYMHRYEPDLLARIRTDYVHEQQSRYHAAIADLESRIDHATTAERVKLNKTLKVLTEQEAEIHEYEEKIHHLADCMISIDPDDGVKNNYAIFKDVLAKIR